MTRAPTAWVNRFAVNADYALETSQTALTEARPASAHPPISAAAAWTLRSPSGASPSAPMPAAAICQVKKIWKNSTDTLATATGWIKDHLDPAHLGVPGMPGQPGQPGQAGEEGKDERGPPPPPPMAKRCAHPLFFLCFGPVRRDCLQSPHLVRRLSAVTMCLMQAGIGQSWGGRVCEQREGFLRQHGRVSIDVVTTLVSLGWIWCCRCCYSKLRMRRMAAGTGGGKRGVAPHGYADSLVRDR